MLCGALLHQWLQAGAPFGARSGAMHAWACFGFSSGLMIGAETRGIEGDNRRKKFWRTLASVVAGVCWGGAPKW
ncbi:hypothetical protein B7486_26000 [cyanobacterium TDX16]|nr:hypothetical protein B7486_26000 [cyanobacterium TDX16]